MEAILGVLAIIPSFFAFIVLIIDKVFDFTDKGFFQRTKRNAQHNLFKQISNNKRIELSREQLQGLKLEIQNWHFDCFKFTLHSVNQLQFLELMLMQCFAYLVIWFNDGLIIGFYLSLILAVAYLMLYIATLIKKENFTWFFPKSNDEYAPNRTLIRRAITIMFVGSLLFFMPTISDLIISIATLFNNIIENPRIIFSSKEILFLAIIMLIAITTLGFLVYSSIKNKFKRFFKDKK